MLKLNDKVKIKSVGAVGEIIDVTASEPHGYTVEWKDSKDKWQVMIYAEAELEKVLAIMK